VAKFLFIVCLLFILLFILAGCVSEHVDFYEPEIEIEIPNEIPDTNDWEEIVFPLRRERGILEVYVFGLSSADSILITTENYVVMIDTGERQHGHDIVEALFSRGIFHIDHLIITHFDRDHVGGAYDIIRFLGVRNIIVPNYHRESNSANRFREAKHRVGIEAYVLTDTISFVLDDATFEIVPSGLAFFIFGNEEDDADETDEDIFIPRENDFSILVNVTHGNNSFLFTGDAMAGRLGEFLEQDEISQVDFLKLPHHGRHNRRTVEFLNAIKPRYAVSTCCHERPIDQRVVAVLENFGTEIFLSIHGGVSARSDGYVLVVSQ